MSRSATLLLMVLNVTVGLSCGDRGELGGRAGAAARSEGSEGGAEVSPDPLSPAESLAQRRPRPRRPPEVNTKAPPELLSASHLLIQYQGATNSKATRSKLEAQALAEQLLRKARAGEPFTDLVRDSSESPDQRGGGYLGVFPEGQPFPEVTAVLKTVAFEEIVPRVVETPFGFHVVRREKTVHIGHLLVMHRDSRFAHEGITRSRDEARAEAARLHKLLTEGADRAVLARESSDCALSKAVGGDLGYYGRGMATIRGGRLLPEMLRVVMRLQPGQISAVTESEYGFHVIWHYPDERPGVAPGPGTPAARGDAGGGEP